MARRNNANIIRSGKVTEEAFQQSDLGELYALVEAAEWVAQKWPDPSLPLLFHLDSESAIQLASHECMPPHPDHPAWPLLRRFDSAVEGRVWELLLTSDREEDGFSNAPLMIIAHEAANRYMNGQKHGRRN